MKKIGADGAARQLKGTLVEYLKEAGYEVEDYGSEAEGVDYPDVAVEVTEAVARGDHDRRYFAVGQGSACP